MDLPVVDKTEPESFLIFTEIVIGSLPPPELPAILFFTPGEPAAAVLGLADLFGEPPAFLEDFVMTIGHPGPSTLKVKKNSFFLAPRI